MSLLRNYFWWTYERGSFHYDVMVTLILLFLFVAPHFIDFKDRPAQTVALGAREVLVKNGANHQPVYEVRASDLGRPANDDEVRAALLQVLEPVAGASSVDSFTPVTDTHGKVVAYDATVSR